MQIVFSSVAEKQWQEYVFAGKKTKLKKITQLLDDIILSPYKGLGKPEALKHQLTGSWSRRINTEDRIVYKLADNTIFVNSIKGHY
ncbi:MAG: Txe/YoeB family addiction module toxin [Bacteroidia bacterium]|nr:Txe/YoeB family addiction module toxin [Bacteroidia bacterium]